MKYGYKGSWNKYVFLLFFRGHTVHTQTTAWLIFTTAGDQIGTVITTVTPIMEEVGVDMEL